MKKLIMVFENWSPLANVSSMVDYLKLGNSLDKVEFRSGDTIYTFNVDDSFDYGPVREANVAGLRGTNLMDSE